MRYLYPEYRIDFTPDIMAECCDTALRLLDEQAAMEKMACGLLGAMQGARTFGYAGVLCVDDLFSGVQLVMDVEMVNYIRETIEAFDPHPDILDTKGLFDECHEVAQGRDTFLSHPNTVRRLRHVMPSAPRLVREKLSSWLHHRTTLKDRARAEALERIGSAEPHHLDEGKQRALDRIYAGAEREFGA
jgi:trimethylamine:corrinoid methyltransferase-like protein